MQLGHICSKCAKPENAVGQSVERIGHKKKENNLGIGLMATITDTREVGAENPLGRTT